MEVTDRKTHLAGGTGREPLQGRAVRLVFEEYIEIQFTNLRFEEPPPPGSIRPIEDGYLLRSYKTARAIEGGWVYLFWLLPSRSRGSYVRIAGEFEVLDGGKYRQYATWDEHIFDDDRSAVKTRRSVPLEWYREGELYAFISQVQLSSRRLRAYRQDAALVKRRGQQIDGQLNSVDGKKRTYSASIDNQLLLASYCCGKYEAHLDEYNELLADKATAEERLLASFTERVVSEYDKHERPLKYDVSGLLRNVRHAEWDLLRHLAVARDKKEFWARQTAIHLKDEALREAREDYWEGDTNTRAAWIEFEGQVTRNLFQADTGKSYLKWMIADRRSLFAKLVAGVEPDAGTYAFKVGRRGVKTVNAAADYLINWALLKTSTGRDLLRAYNSTLPPILDILEVPLDEIAARFVVDGNTVERKLTDLEILRREKFERFVGFRASRQIRRAMPAIVGVLEVINLYFVLTASRGSSKLESWQYYMSVGAAMSYSVSALQNMQKSGSRAYKAFRFIGYAGAAVDIVASIIGASRSVSTNQDVRAIGYGISAIASLMLLAGPASVIGALGITLYLAGFTILTLVGEDTPLENWIKKCKWHPDHVDDKAYHRRHSIRDQLRSLLQIVGKPEAYVFRENGDEASYLVVSLKPTFFADQETTFKVEYTIELVSGTSELPGPDCTIVRDSKGSILEIQHRIKYYSDQLRGPQSMYRLEVRPRFLSIWNDFDKESYVFQGGVKWDG